MAPPRGAWADLPSELLLCITDRLIALRSYLAARGVCTAWRSALPPPSPCLLYVLHLRDTARRPVLAVSHPLERPFLLSTLNSSSWCVGSNDCWLAAVTLSHHVSEAVHVVLRHPLTGQEVALPLMQWERRFEPTWPCVRFKVAFARNPRQDDFAVVAVCGDKTIAYVSAGDETWSFHEIVWDTGLADLVCHDHDGGGGGGSKFYRLTKTGDVLVVRVPHGGHGTNKLVLEPLLPGGIPSDPDDDVFAPPYASVCEHTSAKYLVFCEGNMYQVWRNTGGAVDLPQLPGRDPLRMSENEVFVLRYAPAWRGPCWEALGVRRPEQRGGGARRERAWVEGQLRVLGERA